MTENEFFNSRKSTLEMLRLLNFNHIKPSWVIGKGYKNPRKAAYDWLIMRLVKQSVNKKLTDATSLMKSCGIKNAENIVFADHIKILKFVDKNIHKEELEY